MKKIICLCMLACIVTGCNKYAAKQVSNEQFDAKYAGEINDRTTGVVCYKGYLYLYGNFEGYLKKINLAAVKSLVCIVITLNRHTAWLYIMITSG